MILKKTEYRTNTTFYFLFSVRAGKLFNKEPDSKYFQLVEGTILQTQLQLLNSVAEKAMAPHSSTLGWKIPWTEEPGRLQSWGLEESDSTEQLHFHFSLSCIRKRNGNPLQCSCLENPRDVGAWWAAVYGVAQSQTWLKRLSSSSSNNSVDSWKQP